MAELPSYELLRRVQAGDEAAATAAFDRYVQRLIALVRARIAPRLARRIDAEDVVQSAYRSFFVHAANAEYAWSRSGDLWRLLAQIAVHKLLGQVERHTAARRAVKREAGGVELHEVAGREPEPSPGEAIALAELLHLFHAGLAREEQAVLTARLGGESVEEIAAAIGKSPRTVRRTLAQLELRLERRLLAPRSARSERAALTPDPRATLAYRDYTLERLIGAGGMGKVYRARRRGDDARVALKALHKARQDDPRAVAKFLEEAQILAALDHTGIVRLHGVGRFPGGNYFLVMDFVDGQNLQARLERGLLPLAEAVRIVRDVAEALGHAHRQGVVHGDIKPANVLVDGNGRVVVTDFGLAQFVDSRRSRGTLSVVGGTLGYIAPEVLAGGGAPTPAADVYGLGALLVALVEGRPPRCGWAVDPSWGALEDAVHKCLAVRPGERFAGVGELLTALGGAMGGRGSGRG